MSRTRFNDLSGLKKAALVWLILLGILIVVEFTSAVVYFAAKRYFGLFGENAFLRPTIYEMAYRTLFGRGTVPGSLDRYVFPYADVGRGFARFTARYGYDPWLAYRQLPLTSFQGLGIDRYGFYHNGDEKRELLPKEGRFFRIFILGGSTMAGLGASSNTATIPAQLEKMLNERAGRPKQKHFEVINAGVPGYTSAQELALFALELVHYEPDMVITFDGLNDTFLAGNTDGGVFIPNRKYYQNQLVEAFVNEVGGSPTFRDWARTTFLTFFHPDRYYAGRLAKGPLKKMWKMMQGEAEASQVGSGKGVRFEADRLQYYGANLVSIMGIARAREIYSMHFFQPNLVYRKDKLSKEEESILSDQDRSTVIEKRKFWESADKMFRELNKKYREIPKTKFQSLADLFRDEARQAYVDPGHYNDWGNQVIAERIAEEIWNLVRW